VFGPRQDPNGPYAAVVPRWIANLLKGEDIFINGDGETSRDFCYVGNAVQANLLAAMTQETGAVNQIYNVAVGERTTLNDLYTNIRALVLPHAKLTRAEPIYRDFRAGDVRHSMAEISKAQRLLEYVPAERIGDGLKLTVLWHLRQHRHEFSFDERRPRGPLVMSGESSSASSKLTSRNVS
jgi:UDP-N-acetylglucosamine 4-epimerase